MDAYRMTDLGETIVSANEREHLAIMSTYGQAIAIAPMITDDGEFEGLGIMCGVCFQEHGTPEPIPFMVCSCLRWDCIKDAVREHVQYHADKLLTVREN